MVEQRGWVVEVLDGWFLGMDGRLTQKVCGKQAAYFTNRKVARLAAERLGRKHGFNVTVRSCQRAVREFTVRAAVAA